MTLLFNRDITVSRLYARIPHTFVDQYLEVSINANDPAIRPFGWIGQYTTEGEPRLIARIPVNTGNNLISFPPLTSYHLYLIGGGEGETVRVRVTRKAASDFPTVGAVSTSVDLTPLTALINANAATDVTQYNDLVARLTALASASSGGGSTSALAAITALLNTINDKIDYLTLRSPLSVNFERLVRIRTAYILTASSVYPGGNFGFSFLDDNDPNTGFGTNSDSSAFIEAAYPTPVTVGAILIRNGVVPNFGMAGSYLNGRLIQSSQDDITWVTHGTISGMNQSDASSQFILTLPTPVTARYWRVSGNGYIALVNFWFYS